MRYPWLVVVLVAAAGCGTEEDDRPATAAYIVPAILKPSCATAACHSSATGREGLAFGTIEESCDSVVPPEGTDIRAYLVDEGVGGTRMPLDGPLPEADIALIQRWFDDGFTGCP